MPLSCSSSGAWRAPIAASHASDDERAGHGTVTQLDARLREHELLEHPLECGAPARERDELVVTRTRQLIAERRGQVLGECDLRRPGVEERVEHVGGAVAQEVAETGEERVRVTHLGRSGTHPRERGVGIGRHRSVVAFENRDLVSIARARERGPQSRDPAAHNDDSHRSILPRRARSTSERGYRRSARPPGDLHATAGHGHEHGMARQRGQPER